MANLPDIGGGGGGSLSITADPDLERALGGIQGGLGPQQAPFSPSAMPWVTHWDPSSKPPHLQPPAEFGPGSPGFGVLNPDAKKNVPGFYSDPAQQAGRAGRVERGLDKDRARLQELADAILGRQASPSELADLWGWAIEQIDAAEMMGADPGDPWKWLEQRRVAEEAERAKDEGPSTVTQTQRTLNLTDPVTAEAVIDTTLRNLLGRRASDEEKAQFKATLRAEEEANPTITTTTSTTTPSEDGMDSTVDSSTTTAGGAADPGTFAQSFADDELMGEQKAMLAASYYDVLRGL